jgi:hypothetical protein
MGTNRRLLAAGLGGLVLIAVVVALSGGESGRTEPE